MDEDDDPEIPNGKPNTDAADNPTPIEGVANGPDDGDDQQSTRDRLSTRRLLDEMRGTIDRLEKDDATRGDLKLISRTLRELRHSFRVFSEFRHHRKVTVFGSARTQPDEGAYQHSVLFGKVMAESGWYVLTGAGGGIMEGAHVGAGREMSMGVNIILPFEQEANHIIAGDRKLVNLKYFFTRKLLFVKEVHAIALFAGGFGTQDEGFEALTLIQTGKRDMMPIVCIDEPGGSYWKEWKQFIERQLLGNGLISPDDMSLFLVTENLEEAYDEIMNFYLVYDSMRYIRDRLVLRIRV
ncbi:MAG: LOG family protein, partial [Planctomycetota bacterium]|nr:LOG family protein [Planctomycetota bacterium]